MKNILIFKTDKLGDLLNISPIINNIKINYPNCSITLVCSNYNYSIARYYSKDLKNIVVSSDSIITFLIKNFKSLFLTKYDVLFQLDGKNRSYLSSIFITANKKLCIKFHKKKRIFKKLFTIVRPNIFINLFFDFTENSFEDYNLPNNKNYHYLSLYLKLLSNVNIKVIDKKHYFPLDNILDIHKSSKDYFYIHIDQRWDKFNSTIFDNFYEKISLLSVQNKIIISSNLGGNIFFNSLKKNLQNNINIDFYIGPELNQIISLIYYSKVCISSHSGLIVHAAAAFNKYIIDIVPKNIFNELDRWIPFEVKYKRFDINNFQDFDFKF